MDELPAIGAEDVEKGMKVEVEVGKEERVRAVNS